MIYRRCATTREQYQYDAVGNFEAMIHVAANGNWTRDYSYHEPVLLKPARLITA